jgi:hypothetical protein
MVLARRSLVVVQAPLAQRGFLGLQQRLPPRQNYSGELNQAAERGEIATKLMRSLCTPGTLYRAPFESQIKSQQETGDEIVFVGSQKQNVFSSLPPQLFDVGWVCINYSKLQFRLKGRDFIQKGFCCQRSFTKG